MKNKKLKTIQNADMPMYFQEIGHTQSEYILVPSVQLPS